jgi:hypothetical protein
MPWQWSRLRAIESLRSNSEGHWFCPIERTWREMHWSISPWLTQPPYLGQSIALPSPVMTMGKGEAIPYPGSLYIW